MLSFSSEKARCTGCGACASVCPTDCISLVYDDEGFAYPEVDARCVGCGKCRDVCPLANYHRFDEPGSRKLCVAARHVERTVWEKSSSGGAFTAICQAFCNDGDAVFGARFEELEVVHDYVLTPDPINGFRKSKYVQSDLRDSYRKVRQMLEMNRRVVFSGTPCQVAGLRNVLGKRYNNLLCVDLVCHGVGSPGVFRRYIQHLENKFGSKVTSFTFRNKRVKMGRFFDYIIRIEFENGRIVEDGSDLYNTGFIQCLFLRPSCSQCAFASLDRVGDITLGDLKSRYEVAPGLRGIENLSMVLFNTEKAEEIFGRMGRHLRMHPVRMEDVARTSLQLRQPSPASRERAAFFRELGDGVLIEQALEKYIVKTNPKGLIRRAWSILPDRIRYTIKRKLNGR